MDKQLAQLISDYQAAVGTAVLLMSESGFKIPSSGISWAKLDIPDHGKLNGGIRYRKHGQGCEVSLPEGGVDFDFGHQGQIDEFDEWRLWRFCRDRSNAYTFGTEQALEDCIRHALEEGSLRAAPHGVYHVADSVKTLEEEVIRILVAGCALPHRAQDSVQMLSAQCFESADLMLRQYQSLERLWKKERRLRRSEGVKLRVYIHSWLGYLYATIEGFRELRMRLLLQYKRPASFVELIAKCDEIGRLEKRYANDLRVLRNNIFHLRNNNEAFTQFFSHDGSRMTWAKELHTAFGSFFSSYRILAEVHYVCNGRLGESQLRRD